MSYLVASSSCTIRSNLKTVWNLWNNVSAWPAWDDGLKESSIGEGADQLTLNGRIIMTLKQGAPYPITSEISRLVKDRAFDNEYLSPFGKMVFIHEVAPLRYGRVKITHQVTFTPNDEASKAGFEEHVAGNIRAGLPTAVENLGKMAATAISVQKATSETTRKHPRKEDVILHSEEEVVLVGSSSDAFVKRQRTTQRYWINTVSLEHVKVGVSEGMTQSCHGKQSPLARMSPGDWIIHYSPKEQMGAGRSCQAFTSIGRIADRKPYQHDMGGGFVPWRRDVVYITEVQHAPIAPLLEKLSITKSLRSWGMAFRNGLREIPKEDFKLIQDAMLLKK